MRRLGLSLYPEHSTLEEDKKYLDTASKLGYSRIFASLLELGDDKDKTINRFKETIAYGNEVGFVTIVDMNPRLFKELNISYDDLSFFHDLGAYGIRLDEGFSGMEEAKMTRNPYGLKIEINMSSGTH
ncbi:MupG family TIM beta-alpha barrel fold protein, partial [Oenococcus oeni]